MIYLLKNLILIILLILSVYFDLKFRKIPNYLLLITFIVSVVGNIYAFGFTGLLFSIIGMLTGIALLVIPFSMGGIGAGDVKLLGVVGAIQGINFVLYAFLSTAIWGGILSVIYLCYHKQLRHILNWTAMLFKEFVNFVASKGMQPIKVQPLKSTKLSMPYAVPIFLGTVTILLMGVGL